MVNSGTYYGLSLSASNLGGNPYYNYLISAAVEIPAYAFNLLVLDRPWMGRRRALSGCMLFAGLVLVLTIFVPKVGVIDGHGRGHGVMVMVMVMVVFMIVVLVVVRVMVMVVVIVDIMAVVMVGVWSWS